MRFAIATLLLASCWRPPVERPVPSVATPWCTSALTRDGALVADGDGRPDVVRACFQTQHVCEVQVGKARGWFGRRYVLAVGECEEVRP